MAKIKNRVLSALCVLSMAASLAVMPANAAVTTSSDNDWNTIKTDDCTTNECFKAAGYAGEARINNDYGFMWHYKTAPYGDHNLSINYDITGEFEMTFDYFINDLIEGYEKKIGINEEVARIRVTQPKAEMQCWNEIGWSGSVKKDDNTYLKIVDYAKASRKYGITPADENPTYLEIKVYAKDGKMGMAKKWNTETNWNDFGGGFSKSGTWDKAAPVSIMIWDAWYQSFDNFVVKYNKAPEATADRQYIRATGDTVNVTFSENIGDFPKEIALAGGKNATVAKVDDKNFTLTTPSLSALRSYEIDLSGFKSAKTSLPCATKITVNTDLGNMGSAYTVAARDDFDGTSTLKWEKTENNIETGYSTENGKLTQTAATAETRMRRYLANDYYVEFKANVDEEISFAMCTSDNVMHNKVTFKTDDKFKPGEYVFTSCVVDTKAQWYAANDNGVVWLGEYATDLDTVARPVISSKGTATAIDYITVNIKPDADMSAAADLNEAIRLENEEIDRKERALVAVNSAKDKTEMQTAISSTDLDMYTDTFFAGLGDNTDTYKTAYAEIIFNEREALQTKKFKDLEEFEKYAALALNLLKLSDFTGDELAAQINKISYDGIANTDEDYTNAKAKIADAFKAVRDNKIFKTYDEVKEVFVEAKALGVLNAAKTRDDVPGVIEKYKDDLKLDLTEYNKKSAIKIAPALHEKNFTSKEDVQDAIDKKIKDLNDSTSDGTTGGSSSGSSSSSNSNKGISIVIPGSLIGITPTPSTGATAEQKKTFNDLANVAWAKNAIQKLAEEGIVSGVSATEYEPLRNVTRAEFVKMIADSFAFVAKGEKKFVDVADDAWYAKYVNAVATNGIVNGITENEFAPNSAITRQDAALIIFKCAAEWKAQTTAEPTDADTISEYAAEAVIALFQSGVISGDDDGNFAPKREITRAEAACMLYKALEVLNKI